MTHSVQIIGGGLIGLASAYALWLRGVREITIIEARPAMGQGTSFANAGMVHASLADPWNGPGVGKKILKSLIAPSPAMAIKPSGLSELSGWGRSFLRHANRQSHDNATRHNYVLADHSLTVLCDWLHALNPSSPRPSSGLLKLYRTQESFKRAQASHRIMGDLGLRYNALDPQSVSKLEPALMPIEPEIVGGLFFPDDFIADSHALCQSLAGALLKGGANLINNVKIDRLLVDNNRLVGVHGAGQTFTAETTIIAAGAHSAGLLKTANLSLAVRPVKGYSLSFDYPSDELNERPIRPVVDDNLHAAITPLGDTIRIAGTAQIAGFDPGLNDKDLKPLFAMLRQVYPQLAARLQFDQGKKWCGFRPVSADGMPFIGPTSIKGLVLNTGHGHMGLTFCAGSGNVLADILQGHTPKIDVGAFAPIGRQGRSEDSALMNTK